MAGWEQNLFGWDEVGRNIEFNAHFVDEIIITVDSFEDLIQRYECKL